MLCTALLAAPGAQAAGAAGPDLAALVRDINPATQDTSFDQLTVAGSALFFQGYNQAHGLWRSDGTAAGTALLNPNAWSIGSMTAAGAKLFFVADDLAHGRELWASDGTPAGTGMLRDLTASNAGPAPENLAALNGTLMFTLATPSGTQLWRSDGTPSGTQLVKQFAAQAIGGFKAVNGRLLFFIPGTAPELWKSDGSAAGTARVTTIAGFTSATAAGPALGPPAPPDPNPHNLTVVGGQLFFTSAYSGLWASDGTATGTRRVQAFASVEPTWLTNLDGMLFFAAGSQLWKSDGTPAGTQLLRTHSAAPTQLLSANGMLFYRVLTGGPFNFQLWKSNGTPAGTQLIRVFSATPRPQNIASNTFDASPLASANGYVLFAADDGASGLELWRSDGTSAGTVQVRDINPGGDATPQLLTSGAGQIFFRAYDPLGGVELWRSDGTAAGTRLVKDILAQPAGAAPEQLADVGGKLFFAATSDNQHDELWTSDGTPAGTARMVAFQKNPGVPFGGSVIGVRGGLNNTALFTRYIGPQIQLWRSDGTPAGTAELPLSGSAVESSTLQLSSMVGYHNLLFFLRGSYSGAVELWRSDGTPAGTAPVKTVGTSSGTLLGRLAVLGDKLFFTTHSTDNPSDASHGQVLWRSDGTAAGTAPVATIGTEAGASTSGLVAIGSRLFFALQLSSAPALWASDGTAAGTAKIADLPSGTYFWRFTNANGRLFFVDGNQAALWTSDGTTAGTAKLLDNTGINPFVDAPLPALGGTVFFSALIAPGSQESGLWRSDGTPGGTQLFKRNASDPTVAANTLFFDATDPASGVELWRSDGTLGGTRLVEDIQPGVGSSSPGPVVVSGDHLFFAADTSATGRELWAIRTSAGVDEYVWAPDTSFAAPGSPSTIVIRYANRGTQTASGLTLSATLDPALQYLGDDTGVTPTQSNNTLTWHLPDAGFLDNGLLHLRVGAPAAPLGTRYPVAIAISSTEPEVAPADNSASASLQITRQIFVPLLSR